MGSVKIQMKVYDETGKRVATAEAKVHLVASNAAKWIEEECKRLTEIERFKVVAVNDRQNAKSS